MVLGVLALVGTVASPAFADEYTGFRLGMGLGEDTYRRDIDYSVVGEQINDSQMGYYFFGGWALNKWLAFEGAYRFGTGYNHDFNLDPNFFPAHTLTSKTTVQSFEPSVVGSWWITPNFGVYGRVGVWVWRGEVTFTEDLNTGDTFKPDQTRFTDNGTSLIYAGGLQTTLDRAIVRLEYQQTETSDFKSPSFTSLNNKITSLMLSVVWKL
jgi:hypothetical protein